MEEEVERPYNVAPKEQAHYTQDGVDCVLTIFDILSVVQRKDRRLESVLSKVQTLGQRGLGGCCNWGRVML